MPQSGNAAERLRECMSYRVDGPYIVVVNNCQEQVKLRAIEVKYYVNVARGETLTSDLEVQTVRKEITERMTVDKHVEPGSRLEIYFGPIENIDEVYAVIDYNDEQYRVQLEYAAEESAEASR